MPCCSRPPAFSLLGLTEEPALLDGYGPIPPSMARALVAEAPSFRRVLTDPRDGEPLEIGRTSYRVPKPLRQWLRLRDAKCTFPGCNNHSLDNDADHLLAWARGGPTGRHYPSEQPDWEPPHRPPQIRAMLSNLDSSTPAEPEAGSHAA